MNEGLTVDDPSAVPEPDVAGAAQPPAQSGTEVATDSPDEVSSDVGEIALGPVMSNAADDEVINKAETMAYSAKEDRDIAATERRRNREDAELWPDIMEFFSTTFDSPEQEAEARTALRDRIAPIGIERSSSFRTPMSDAHMDLLYPEDAKNFRTPQQREQYSARMDELRQRREDLAKEKDKFADRVEDLAGIMHEHPVSARYAEAHRRVDLTPRGLIALETSSDSELAKIEEREARLDEMSDLDMLNGRLSKVDEAFRSGGFGQVSLSEHTAEYIAERISATDKQSGVEFLHSFYELTRNAGTATISEYTSLFKDGIRKGFIDPSKKMALAAKSVVDDVRSGRASDSPPPMAEAA